MGLKQSDLCTEEPRFSYLGPWHANLIHIDRRKWVLLVNDKTLFTFIMPDVSRAQIRELDKLFKSYLSCVLVDAGISEAERARILSEYDEVGFTNTNSKSVLGSMNDLVFHYRRFAPCATPCRVRLPLTPGNRNYLHQLRVYEGNTCKGRALKNA